MEVVTLTPPAPTLWPPSLAPVIQVTVEMDVLVQVSHLKLADVLTFQLHALITTLC